MTVDATARGAEQAKYVAAYGLKTYAMGNLRMKDAVGWLNEIPRGSYLDVGCGRGEMLANAERAGFGPVKGVECVPELIDGERVIKADAHQLPFKDGAFHLVSMLDVIEHLLPGDDEAACREIDRVARSYVLLTASNRPSKMPDGTNLHINIRSYVEWDCLFKEWFSGDVQRMTAANYVSEGWRIDYR